MQKDTFPRPFPPCGSGRAYERCCGPLHAGGAAETAQQLMRSRFSAFARGLDAYLLASWHPSTRPATLELDEGVQWRRLQIVDAVAGAAGDAEGVVEFRASYRDPDGAAGLLHERSRFVRDSAGRWSYLDGETR